MADFLPASVTPSPRQAALLATAFGLVLDPGEPATLAQLTALTGCDPESVEGDLQQLSGIGRVQRTADGAVSGCLGLTLEPSNHAICVNGALRHTWCALDAFGIMGALQATGWIDSRNGETGRRFRVDVETGAPADPGRPWVVFILERQTIASVIAEWCPMVNIFEDEQAAQAWAAAKGVTGQCLSLAETAAVGTDLWRPRIMAGQDGHAVS